MTKTQELYNRGIYNNIGQRMEVMKGWDGLSDY